jgi:hypothetical protein
MTLRLLGAVVAAPLHRGFLVALASVALLAACAHSPTEQVKRPWFSATSTNQWNDFANDLIARNAVGQVGALRTLAYLNLAINNAIVQADKDKQATDGAVAGAAAAVLSQLFAKDEAAVNARVQREIQAIGSGRRAAFQAGVDLGRKVGDQVVAQARADRIAAAWTGTVPVGEGKWASLVTPPAPPLAPALGNARTFYMKAGDEFRAPPPPAWGSAAFQAQIAEVRAIADSRTNEQIRIAQYWEDLTGSFAAGAWNVRARNAMAAKGLDEATTARALAMMHMAGFDAVVACHDSKYTYWVPRPAQADPKITLAVGVPNHPSYPANHACISGAMGRVLDAQVASGNGVFETMGKEAGTSRVYGGIHYQMDVDAGDEIARKIAARAAQAGPARGQAYTPAGR